MNKKRIIEKIKDFVTLLFITYLVESTYLYFCTKRIIPLFDYKLLKDTPFSIIYRYRGEIDYYCPCIDLVVLILVSAFHFYRKWKNKPCTYLKVFMTFNCIFLFFDMVINAFDINVIEVGTYSRLLYNQLPYTILSLSIMGVYYILKTMNRIEKIKEILSSKRNQFWLFFCEFFILFYSSLSLLDYWLIKREGIIYSFLLSYPIDMTKIIKNTNVSNLIAEYGINRKYLLFKRMHLTTDELMVYKIIIVMLIASICAIIIYYSYKQFKASQEKGLITIGYTLLGMYLILSNCIFYISTFDWGVDFYPYCGMYNGEIIPNYILSQIIFRYSYKKLIYFKRNTNIEIART